jgi:outer membrane assembly lipoprotein YfiO
MRKFEAIERWVRRCSVSTVSFMRFPGARGPTEPRANRDGWPGPGGRPGWAMMRRLILGRFRACAPPDSRPTAADCPPPPVHSRAAAARASRPPKRCRWTRCTRKPRRALDEGEVGRAVKFYERLVARFPYGRYHEQAQIELAYALYRRTTSRTRRCPRSTASSRSTRRIARIDYAYYLRGLVNFNRRIGLLEKYFSHDTTRRDLQYVRQSFQDFGELLNKYPDSKLRRPTPASACSTCATASSNAELMVANYYFRRGAYIAAADSRQVPGRDLPGSPGALPTRSRSWRRATAASAAPSSATKPRTSAQAQLPRAPVSGQATGRPSAASGGS